MKNVVQHQITNSQSQRILSKKPKFKLRTSRFSRLFWASTLLFSMAAFSGCATTSGASASSGQAADPGLKTDSLERIQALVVPTVDSVPCSYPCSDSFETDEGGMQSTLNVPFKTVPGGLAVTVNTDRKIAVVAVNGQALGTIDLTLLGNPKYTVFAVEQGEDKDGEYADVYIAQVRTFDSSGIPNHSRYLVFTFDATNNQLYQEVVGTLHSNRSR